MDRELASRQAGKQSDSKLAAGDDSQDSDDEVDIRAMGRQARRRHGHPVQPASSTSGSQGSAPPAAQAGSAPQEAVQARTGVAVSPIISADDFKLQVPPELDAYDPESGISYVQHAENVLAARSARRATAVRTVFDKVLTSLGGARSLKPKHVKRIARELGLPQEQLAAMVDPKHQPGRKYVADPPRGAPDRAGSVVSRILSMIDATEEQQSVASDVDPAVVAARAQRAQRREESRRTRLQLQRAEHEVLMNTTFSPSPIQLSLSEGGGEGKEGGGGDDSSSPPVMDTRLGSGGDAILDMLVPPEDTWHQAAQIARDSGAPSSSAAAPATSTAASAGESSELAQVLAMLEQEATSGGQGTSEAYQQLAGFPKPPSQGGGRKTASASESKVVVSPPPVGSTTTGPAATSPGRQGHPEHAAFHGADDAAEDDDDAFSIGSTKWDDDDGVVDTRAYFEAGVGGGAAASAAGGVDQHAVQSSARNVGADLSDAPELDGTGMTDDHREAVAASMALLANEPGMEFLRDSMGGGGGYGAMGYPGM